MNQGRGGARGDAEFVDMKIHLSLVAELSPL